MGQYFRIKIWDASILKKWVVRTKCKCFFDVSMHLNQPNRKNNLALSCVESDLPHDSFVKTEERYITHLSLLNHLRRKRSSQWSIHIAFSRLTRNSFLFFLRNWILEKKRRTMGKKEHDQCSWWFLLVYSKEFRSFNNQRHKRIMMILIIISQGI